MAKQNAYDTYVSEEDKRNALNWSLIYETNIMTLNYHYQGKKVSYEDYIIMRMIEYMRKHLLSYITDTPAQLQYRGYSRAAYRRAVPEHGGQHR